MGVRFPRRVVGGGGLYLEYDGRDVPDVATVVADYDEGCQVIISATMCNDVQLGEVIRGHTGDDHVRGPTTGSGSSRRRSSGRPAPPGQNKGEGGELVTADFNADGDGDTRALWDHFIECIRSRNPETLCPAELGYAAIATVNLGVDSYRDGKAYFFDKETGKVSEADDALGQEVGEDQPRARQAGPGHGLEGRPARGLDPRRRRATRSSRATGSTARTRPRRPERSGPTLFQPTPPGIVRAGFFMRSVASAVRSVFDSASRRRPLHSGPYEDPTCVDTSSNTRSSSRNVM